MVSCLSEAYHVYSTLSDLQTVQGLVHNYGGLLGDNQSYVLRYLPLHTHALSYVGMRWMLGVFEAGLFPGVNYYLSW